MKRGQEIRNLNERNAVLELEKCSLYEQLQSIKQNKDCEVQIESILAQIFSTGQIKLLLKKNKRIQE